MKCNCCKPSNELVHKKNETYEMDVCPVTFKVYNYVSFKKVKETKVKSQKNDKIVDKEKIKIEPVISKKIDIPVNIIYNEKCEITMSKMKDSSIDYVFTSPPYNLSTTVSEKGKSGKMYKNFEDKSSQQDYYNWQVNLITELLRVTKNHVFYNNQLLTNNKTALLTLLDYFKYKCKEVLVWDKKVAAPATTKGTFDSRFELVIAFSNQTPNERSFKDGNFHGTESNVINLHKTQNKLSYLNKAVFPINLPRKFMELFGKDGDIWYDPFGGTGTTGVAAVLAKKNYILSEMDATQCKEAYKRIKEYINSPKLW